MVGLTMLSSAFKHHSRLLRGHTAQHARLRTTPTPLQEEKSRRGARRSDSTALSIGRTKRAANGRTGGMGGMGGDLVGGQAVAAASARRSAARGHQQRQYENEPNRTSNRTYSLKEASNRLVQGGGGQERVLGVDGYYDQGYDDGRGEQDHSDGDYEEDAECEPLAEDEESVAESSRPWGTAPDDEDPEVDGYGCANGGDQHYNGHYENKHQPDRRGQHASVFDAREQNFYRGGHRDGHRDGHRAGHGAYHGPCEGSEYDGSTAVEQQQHHGVRQGGRQGRGELPFPDLAPTDVASVYE